METPRVSVVMAVHNGYPYLADSVESILRQSYKDLELVVVDDASVDDSWQILTRLAAGDPRLVLLRNQVNEGVVRSLNRGLDRACGSVLARQDADDISDPERIARQLSFLDDNPEYGVVAAVPQPIDACGNPLCIRGWDAREDAEIRNRLVDHMCLCGPSLMIRRECLTAAGFYFADGLDASEDYDLCLRLAEVTKLASLDGGLYRYRQHPESASSRRAAVQMYRKALALERALERRKGQMVPPNGRKILARDYLHAGIIAAAGGDYPSAKEWLGRAQHACSGILDSDEPLESLVRSYTPTESVEAALRYTRSVFDEILPKSRRLWAMRNRLLSYLHMAVVFADGVGRADLRAHLWAGIRYRPLWLFNPGVVSLARQAVVNARRENSRHGGS